MNTPLLMHDLIGVWATELKVISIPAIIIGAGIGLTIRRWIACALVSYGAAFYLVYTLPLFRQPHHAMSVSEVMVWSAVLALLPILALTSLGYFAVRWIQARRAKHRTT